MKSRRKSRGFILPQTLKEKILLVPNQSWLRLLHVRNYDTLDAAQSQHQQNALNNGITHQVTTQQVTTSGAAPSTPQSNIILITNRHNHSQLYVLKCEHILAHSDWNERCYRELLVYRALRNLVLGRRSPHFVSLLDWWKSYGGPVENKTGATPTAPPAKRRISRLNSSRRTSSQSGADDLMDDASELYPDEASIPVNNRKKLMKHAYMNFVLEKADGTLAKYLQEHDNCLTPFLFKYILFQLFFALYQAQSDCEFVHNDLHLSNILFLKTHDADKYCYHVEHATFLPGRFNPQDAQILIKITDFGNSRARLNDTADIVYNASLDQHSQFNASTDIEKIMSEVRTVRVDWDSLPADEAQTQKILYQKLRLESGKIGVQPRDLLRHEFFDSFKITDGYDQAGIPSSYMIHFGDFMQPNPMPPNDFDDVGGNKEGEYYEPGGNSQVGGSSKKGRKSTSEAVWTKCGRTVLKSNGASIGSVRLFNEGGVLTYKPPAVNITKLMPVDKFDKIPLQNVEVVYFEPLLDSNKDKLSSIYKILRQEKMCGTTDADPSSDHVFCLVPSSSRFVRKFDLKSHPFVGAFISVDPSQAGGAMVQPSPFLTAPSAHEPMLTPSPFMGGAPPAGDPHAAAPYGPGGEAYPVQYPAATAHDAAPQYGMPAPAYGHDEYAHRDAVPPPHSAGLPPPPLGADPYDAYGAGRAPSVHGAGYYDHAPPPPASYPGERFTPERYSSLPPPPPGGNLPPHGPPPPGPYYEPHYDDARMYDRYGSPPRHGGYHGRGPMDLKRKRSPGYYDRERFYDDRYTPERDYRPHKRMRRDREYDSGFHGRDRHRGRSFSPDHRERRRDRRRHDSPREGSAEDGKSNELPSHFIKIKEPTNSIWIGLKRYHDMFPEDSLQDCFRTLRKDFGEETLINLLPQHDKVSPKCAFLNFTSVEKAKEAYAFIEKVKYKIYPSLRYTVPRKDARNSM